MAGVEVEECRADEEQDEIQVDVVEVDPEEVVVVGVVQGRVERNKHADKRS